MVASRKYILDVLSGSLLLMDIEVDSFARKHPFKQRSQLFGWGQISIPSPISPKHHVRLQPPSDRPQRLRPGHQRPPFFPSPPVDRRESLVCRSALLAAKLAGARMPTSR